ncbi:hypothetical protein EV207_101224 [Scopulibacillus darangshiensis]|uniref:Ribosomal processing cysteine protease Prp n=1 Tax=Scopulibacillus darangshiensis TaxID=442528 RepID=A0A4V2SNS1_9BACL|nr:ribosomal-processing cysteine protease Prp [Scopulibacillus darangshiensis]TCP32246.1 hypothetical protein EV207_101224 [Scopulibacillus darangshiensis]
MIKVNVHRDHRGNIESFTMEGHADSGPHGFDLVCAGASAVSFGSLNAVQAIAGIELDVWQAPEGGYLRCQLPMTLHLETQRKVQILLEGMIVSLQTIEASYGEHIQINDQGGGKDA